MIHDRLEYFANFEDHLSFFEMIDSQIKLKVTEQLFKKSLGPKIFNSLTEFLYYHYGKEEVISKRSIFYASQDPLSLKSRDIIGCDDISEFDFIRNPDLISLNIGYNLDEDRILISQLGALRNSKNVRPIFSKIVRLSKKQASGSAITVTGEIVFTGALGFVKNGGRLVRTLDAPPAFDARVLS